MINETVQPSGGGTYTTFQDAINAHSGNQADNVTITFNEDLYHQMNLDFANVDKVNRTSNGFYFILDGTGTGAADKRATFDTAASSTIMFDIDNCENIVLQNFRIYDVSASTQWEGAIINVSDNIHLVNNIFDGGNSATNFISIISSKGSIILNNIVDTASANAPSACFEAYRTDQHGGDNGESRWLHNYISSGTGNSQTPLNWANGHATLGHRPDCRALNNVFENNRQLQMCFLVAATPTGKATDAPIINNNVYVRRPQGWTVTTNTIQTTNITVCLYYGTNYSSVSAFNSAEGQEANGAEIGPQINAPNVTQNFSCFMGWGVDNAALSGQNVSGFNITVSGDAIVECDKDIFGNTRTNFTPGPVEVLDPASGPDLVPPTWDTTTGIQTLEVTNANFLKATWNSATDASNPPTVYNIYMRPGSAPDSFGTSSVYYFGTTDNLQAVINRDPNDTDAENPIGRPLKAGTEYFVIIKASDQLFNEDTNTTALSATTRIETLPVGSMQNIIRKRFRDQIELVFTNLSGRVQYDNAPLIVKPNALWVRLAIRPVGSNQVAFGRSIRTRNTGSMVASIFAPTNVGSKEMNDLADLIHAEFGKLTVDNIVYGTPTNLLVGREGKEWQLDVSVPYHGDSLK